MALKYWMGNMNPKSQVEEWYLDLRNLTLTLFSGALLSRDTIAMRFLCLIASLATASALSLSSSFTGSSRAFSAPTLSTRAPACGASSLQMISHGKRVAKLGRPADQRKALLRALTTEIIRHGRVKTTLVRARAVRPFVDKMIQLSKDGSLHSRRQVTQCSACAVCY